MNSIVDGIEWAIQNEMQVINMSFGTPADMPDSVVKALNDAYEAGIVIVAAASKANDTNSTNDNIRAPARYGPVIAVGATDEQDSLYAKSGTGSTLGLVAPGTDIYSTAMGGGYAYLTGTSAASPHVAGVAALLIASGISNNIDVRNRLCASAEDLGEPGRDLQFGYGMVNATASVSSNDSASL